MLWPEASIGFNSALSCNTFSDVGRFKEHNRQYLLLEPHSWQVDIHKTFYKTSLEPKLEKKNCTVSSWLGDFQG